MEEWKNEYWNDNFRSYSCVLQDNGEVHQTWVTPIGVDVDNGTMDESKTVVKKYKDINNYNKGVCFLQITI